MHSSAGACYDLDMNNIVRLGLFYALCDRVRAERLPAALEEDWLTKLERFLSREERITNPPRFMRERLAFYAQSLGMDRIEHDNLADKTFHYGLR